jgi:hypothetical protein
MTLSTAEFIRRFLIHVLPQGFHRIRHYGLLASGTRADNIARARELLAVSNSQAEPTGAAVDPGKPTCLAMRADPRLPGQPCMRAEHFLSVDLEAFAELDVGPAMIFFSSAFRWNSGTFRRSRPFI